ncbi:type IV pilus modification PilV family protein [Neptunicella sp. SCSIO 80796]|uniref:type IV pilus modification PilV family protein n=1 Tax=Neptunicella plasticusilytica TaxID=3117012 RepID=UPI003A4D533D
MPASAITRQYGFNLIELIIGIVVFSIALMIILSLIVPQSARSIDPIYQVRATELAQSMLNEITAKAFDENSDKAGGLLRCGETGATNCTVPADLGAEGEDRRQFDDVDDYNGLSVLADSMGNPLSNLYVGFAVQVRVFYDADMDGIDDNAIGNSKLIQVTVITPNNEDIVFTTFRANY